MSQAISQYTKTKLLALIILVVCTIPVWALEQSRIALLDFELNDLTLRPNAPQELLRTASLSPLLHNFLSAVDNFSLVKTNSEEQAEFNVSPGYLFAHPEALAELGVRYHADYIIAGQLQKPSYLFAYLAVYLVDVQTKKIIGKHTVELKGATTSHELTQRGIIRLAQLLREDINALNKNARSN